jgi:hypothetical protein
VKTRLISATSLLLLAALAVGAVAQERPPRPDDRGDGASRPGRPDGPRGGGDAGPDRPARPEGRPDAPRPPGSPDMQRFEMMRGYLELVDRFARLSRDPTTAGVAAVISAADILRPRGADAGIEFFNKMLQSTKNESVQRAIRMQLIELYKQSGQHDQALEQLNQLITGAPAGG